jgi:hypothetical protein
VTVFDDSFEHEIVFPADDQCEADGQSGDVPAAAELIGRGRLVLLFDAWNPSLTSAEIQGVRHILCTMLATRAALLAWQMGDWLAGFLRAGAPDQHAGACHCKQPRVCAAG